MEASPVLGSACCKQVCHQVSADLVIKQAVAEGDDADAAGAQDPEHLRERPLRLLQVLRATAGDYPLRMKGEKPCFACKSCHAVRLCRTIRSLAGLRQPWTGFCSRQVRRCCEHPSQGLRCPTSPSISLTCLEGQRKTGLGQQQGKEQVMIGVRDEVRLQVTPGPKVRVEVLIKVHTAAPAR